MAAQGVKTKTEQFADILKYPDFSFVKESVSGAEEPESVNVLKHPLKVIRVSDVLPKSAFGKKYHEHVFETKELADEKAEEMKQEYGYRPEVFRLTKKETGEVKYIVVEPEDVERISP
jgi:hypothetical protein